MKTRKVMVIVCVTACFVSLKAVAATVIYEPFADGNSTLTGNTPGTGLTGTWTATATWPVDSGSLMWGSLSVSGNRARGSVGGAASVSTGTSLSSAGLLDHGSNLWFSIVYTTTPVVSGNPDAGFALGTDSLGSVNNIPMNSSGKGIGFSIKTGVMSASTWVGGTIGRTTDATGSEPVTGSTTYLIVGQIIWGADGTATDTINLYRPNSSLALGSVVATRSAVLDQSLFDTVTYAQKADSVPCYFDEIRFGATSADVLPVDTVAPALVSITDDKAGGPIGEDVAEVTYTLTFDKHMDLSTITAADFDNAGTATATVGTPTQVSQAVIRVKLLPTTTGTLQLRIPSGSVLSSFVPLNLDTTSAILDETTITINSGTTPVAGTLYWDGSRTSGITDGTSQGGTATWNTTTTCWDLGAGLDGPFAWNNSSSLSAVFGGTAGTVTLGTDITLQGLTIGTASGYFIGNTTEDNTLTFSGTKTITVNSVDATIQAGIAGSPTLNISGLTYFSLLPPANVTMTLGTLNMLNPNAQNKSLVLGGAGTNVVDTVTWVVTANQLNLTMAGTGSWTINNNLAFNTGGSRASKLYVQQGTLTLLGSNHFLTHKIGVASNAGSNFTASNLDSKLIAKGTITIGDNREFFYVQNKGTLSPGPGVATLNVTWNANTSTSTANGEFNMQTGSIYEWDIASKTSTDVINVTTGASNNGNLILGNMTIKIKDAGVTTPIVPSDKLTVFTYETGAQAVVRSIGTVTIDTSALPGGWTGTPSLVDDLAGKIYVTGLQSPVSGTVIQLK